MTSVRKVLHHHFRHFNARSLVEASHGWVKHLDRGGKMLVSMAGAMSTAELGVSLAEMIRQDKVHAISCTGANLEEDLFNLVANEEYVRVPDWRNLTPQQEAELRDKGLNRVTDTCIPEEQAMRKIERHVVEAWRRADAEDRRAFPHEHLFEVLRSGVLAPSYQIDPRNSWLLAAAEKDLPVFVPGWEDSTLGNVFAARVLRGDVSPRVVKSGVEYMTRLVEWYRETSARASIGFFQIGGGIAGDFAMCTVPLLRLDLGEDVPYWGYYCQITDSTTSFGSYSGCTPNEKITWHKLDVDTPAWVIESDATIVAPLMFSYVLGSWNVPGA